MINKIFLALITKIIDKFQISVIYMLKQNQFCLVTIGRTIIIFYLKTRKGDYLILCLPSLKTIQGGPDIFKTEHVPPFAPGNARRCES